MKQVYLIYWDFFGAPPLSKKRIGIATSIRMAVSLLARTLSEKGHPLNKHERKELTATGRLFRDSGAEYQIVQFDINTITL